MTVKIVCPYCHFSKAVPKEKIPAKARWATCPSCGQRFELPVPEKFTEHVHEEPLLEPGIREDERKGAPWEKRSELGLWHGIYDTFKAVLFSPKTFYRSLSRDDGIKEPLAFGILVGSFGRMFGVFWHFLIFSGSLLALGQSVFSNLTIGLIFLIVITMIPFFLIVSIFIYSGILHLLLYIVGGGKKGFEATFRVVSYAQATQAWVLIPFIGGWIGGVWQLIVQIIGLREIHESSYSRVIIAFLIPIALIFLVTVGVLVTLLFFLNRHWTV